MLRVGGCKVVENIFVIKLPDLFQNTSENRLKSDKGAQYIALYTLSLDKNHSKMEENLLQYLCIVQQEHCRLFHAAWPTCLFLT